jgi:hypothetical protein
LNSVNSAEVVQIARGKLGQRRRPPKDTAQGRVWQKGPPLRAALALFVAGKFVARYCTVTAAGRSAPEIPPFGLSRSKRSRFITFVHAATKSFTNFSFESAQA